MKIIICGAGPVGTGIARQLAQEDNDVTIVDDKPSQIAAISESIEVTAFSGSPAHPDVLENAGAADAEMIIAVTTSDEVNMVICQIAHSLFNVPIKVARIRDQNYLKPIWKDLYRHDHLPIDYIISPEKEVAMAIIHRLHVPGAMDCIPFADEKMKMIEVRIPEDCMVLGCTIEEIHDRCEDSNMQIMAINRHDHLFIPTPKTTIRTGDEVYFIGDVAKVHRVMPQFGYDDKEARRVLIIGGGNIGAFIAEELERESQGIHAKIIELDIERAEEIASKLSRITVLNGDCLDQDILHEAGIGVTETVISVTNDDEVNILSSLLSKRFGAKHCFTLINKSRSYGPLINSLGIDVVVNPREMTVSSILQHTRRGLVRAAHSICGGNGEVIETEVGASSSLIEKSIAALHLPQGVKVVAILRDGHVIMANDKTIIAEFDRLVIMALTSQVRHVDAIFSSRMDYF